MALNALRALPYLFRLTIEALFAKNIPFSYRWRMLVLQPPIIIIYLIQTVPRLLTPASSTTIFIPTRSGPIRALLYLPRRRSPGSLSPLHLDLHSGSFVAGYPENHTQFHEQVVKKTGAVVIACHYRVAPVHVFPAAIDDVDDVVAYMQRHAASLWNADAHLLTVSGFSAGANLALALCQQPSCHKLTPTAVKASVTFYAPLDLRIPPWVKPKSAGFPKRDPMAFLLPLYDAYAAEPVRAQEMTNARLSPILAHVDTLPERMLLVIAGIDIVVHEQLVFAERVRAAIEGLPGRECVARVVEGAFHGWLELPFELARARKRNVWNMAVEFLGVTHRRYGWHWEEKEEEEKEEEEE